MEKLMLIVQQLKNKAAQLSHLSRLAFKKGETFGWDHTAYVITYNPNAANAQAYLLHEFGHAMLRHSSYERDIALLRMERDAWDAAVKVGGELAIEIDSDIIEDSLDTYRDWLHSRSLCPSCGATGIQVNATSYKCLSCTTVWKVNEARTCALRRYISK